MAQVDVQWPSEDEDFDAKSSKEGTKNADVKTAPAVTEDVEQSEEQSSNEEDQQNDGGTVEEASKSTEPESAAADNDAGRAKVTSDQQATQPSTKKSGGSRKSNMPLIRLICEAVLVLVVIGLGLWTWTLENDRKNLQTQVASLNVNPQVAVQKQTQILINQVGKLMQLPSGEVPTVVEVSNATQAKKQSPFFANSQDGDKVLLYIKAGEAILYRPSTNKIVVVAPITYNNTPATASK